MRLSEAHKPKCGVEGRCSVAMFSGGVPNGFCDDPAWGEQYEGRFQVKHNPPLALGYCCPKHGGPDRGDVRFIKDGSHWCAFYPGFENLQESEAGFGLTQEAAFADLLVVSPAPQAGGEL